MEIGVISASKKNQSVKLDISEHVFGQEFNEALVHQVVTAYLAGARAGTHAQKTRAEVRGGGAKPWKQKGMGRARAGTIRSPIWRTGGKTFAARTQDYSQKVNRKMFRGALRAIFSELIKQNRLLVVDQLTVEEPKTKLLINKLHTLHSKEKDDKSTPRNILIVAETVDTNILLASRNIPVVSVCNRSNLSPVDLVSHDMIIIESEALKKIEETLL
jgi:large subunit ribosomal protein L4